MNCSACGTQLPQEAANCPRCGAAAPSYYSYVGTAPNDPTVMSFPDAVAQQSPPPTGYGSPPYGAAPATPYDPAPYGTTPQGPYGSPSYQNPYDVAPPPSPQRPDNHIGVIIGVVLLVLILIGGGVFGWLAYSSARNAAATTASATATANANATASAIAATQNFTAKGTFTLLSTTTTSFRQDGQNKTYGLTVQEASYGDVAGPVTNEETSILHPDNTSNFYGTGTCTCTVDGKSGTLMWSFTGTQTADGSFQGQVSDVHGTGDLAKLQGQGDFQGQGSNGIYSDVLHFNS